MLRKEGWDEGDKIQQMRGEPRVQVDGKGRPTPQGRKHPDQMRAAGGEARKRRPQEDKTGANPRVDEFLRDLAKWNRI